MSRKAWIVTQHVLAPVGLNAAQVADKLAPSSDLTVVTVEATEAAISFAPIANGHKATALDQLESPNTIRRRQAELEKASKPKSKTAKKAAGGGHH